MGDVELQVFPFDGGRRDGIGPADEDIWGGRRVLRLGIGAAGRRSRETQDGELAWLEGGKFPAVRRDAQHRQARCEIDALSDEGVEFGHGAFLWTGCSSWRDLIPTLALL